MTHHWQMPKPEVLITITGGAQDFKMDTELRVAFGDGLAAAASSARAWIITGGTDTGVMKLVGDAMHERGVNVPVLGIAPWGAINERHILDEAVGKVASCSRIAPSADGALLNPYHSHFVLVDDGTEKSEAWGSEVTFRSKFESHVAQARACGGLRP